MKTKIVESIIVQHADEAAFLWQLRRTAVTSPRYVLRDIAEIDERIAAHIDGLRIAGEMGWQVCKSQLATGESGEMFAAMTVALTLEHSDAFEELIEHAERIPGTRDGLVAALGWTSPQRLRGRITSMLHSTSLRQCMAIACCSMHRVDPGQVLSEAMRRDDLDLRASALRAAGELGRVDLLAAALESLRNQDEAVRYWSARSALLLGDRSGAIDTLASIAADDSAFAPRAIQPLVRAAPLARSRTFLRALAARGDQDPALKRSLIRGCGIAGDVQVVPWLIGLMSDEQLARIAGEAFSTITGADLMVLQLERPAPPGIDFGPNDDPQDTNVAMDEDDGLAWPDGERVSRWWQEQQHRFRTGARYFMGAPILRDACLSLLGSGNQATRAAAAEHLSLLAHGTPLFPTRAPAWRQHEWLARRPAP